MGYRNVFFESNRRLSISQKRKLVTLSIEKSGVLGEAKTKSLIVGLAFLMLLAIILFRELAVGSLTFIILVFTQLLVSKLIFFKFVELKASPVLKSLLTSKDIEKALDIDATPKRTSLYIYVLPSIIFIIYLCVMLLIPIL